MKSYIILAGLVIATLSTEIYAQCTTTIPGGTISGDAWNKAGSPYCIEGDILVNNLTIDPGVRVEFAGNYELEVAGVLSAVGTDLEQIVFTTTVDNAVGWQGVFFNISLPGSELIHVIVENSIDSGVEINSSQPSMRDCVIRNNVGPSNSLKGGGGIYTDTPLTLTRCSITDNSVSGGAGPGGTAQNYGGGIYSDADLTILDSTIINNTASSSSGSLGSNAYAHGGGIYAAAALTVLRSIVDSNAASATALGVRDAKGGGIYALGSTDITNTIITRNTGNTAGGGIYLDNGGTLIHVTVANNAGDGLSNGVNATNPAVVTNSIFWENTLTQISGLQDVTFSDVQDHVLINGNVSINPLFKNPDPLQLGYDVHLDDFSPVIDIGTNSFPGLPSDDIDHEARPQQNGFDMGADEVPNLQTGPDLTARVESFTSINYATNLNAVFQIENVGDQFAGNFEIVVLLIVGTDRTLLGYHNAQGGLDVGQSIPVIVDHVSAESLTNGTIVAVIDFRNTVSEGDETNNRKSIKIP